MPAPLLDRSLWPALLPPAGLAGLGLLFILWPSAGAALFGLPPPEGTARAWLAVVGLRDLVFAGYAFALAALVSRRALGVLLAVTALIPVGDVAILFATGSGRAWHVALHLGSGAMVAGAAWWALRGPGAR
jgi:hypothetical protein